MVQAVCFAVCYALYPLYIKDTYGWAAREYAYLITAADLASTAAIASFPSVEARLGRYRTCGGACLVAAASAIAMVSTPRVLDPSTLSLHVAAAVGFSAATALAFSCLILSSFAY